MGRPSTGAVPPGHDGARRRGVNPLTGEIVPVTFIGQMVPGTGIRAA